MIRGIRNTLSYLSINMLKINIQPVTAFAQNSSLLICPVTQQAVLVDPGGDPQILILLIKMTAI